MLVIFIHQIKIMNMHFDWFFKPVEKDRKKEVVALEIDMEFKWLSAFLRDQNEVWFF
jgi:hypothetical protein